MLQRTQLNDLSAARLPRNLSNPRHQRLCLKGLNHVILCSQFYRTHHKIIPPKRRCHNDPRHPLRLLTTQLLHQRITVHLRHDDVQHHHVHPALSQCLQRFQTIGAFAYHMQTFLLI